MIEHAALQYILETCILFQKIPRVTATNTLPTLALPILTNTIITRSTSQVVDSSCTSSCSPIEDITPRLSLVPIMMHSCTVYNAMYNPDIELSTNTSDKMKQMTSSQVIQ